MTTSEGLTEAERAAWSRASRGEVAVPAGVIGFGKHRGEPVEALAGDPGYCDWLRRQKWVKRETEVAGWLAEHPEVTEGPRAPVDVQQPSWKVAGYQRMYPEAPMTTEARDAARELIEGRTTAARGRVREAIQASAPQSPRYAAADQGERAYPPGVISLGKHEGEPFAALARDPAYCDWVRANGTADAGIAAWVEAHPEVTAARSPAAPAALPGEAVARYEYRDAAGDLRYTVIRFAPKAFAIEAADGTALPDPVPRGLAVLYGLPELLATAAGSTVYVCEGEKDADAVAALGLAAVTNPCGTRMGWLDSYTPHLAGRHVVILPDADGPGRKHAAKVAEALSGTALSVVACDLHEGKRGPWDVSDWLRQGLGAEGLARRAARARYAAVGREFPRGGPAKLDKEDLIFSARLGSTAKLVLLAACYLQSWGEAGAWPSASEIGAAASLHRVTAQNAVTGLRRSGVLPASGGVAWDVLALS